MKTNRHTVRLALLSSLVALSLSLPGIVSAEEKTWEIKPNDTLGIVVAKQYPGYGNRNAIMQAILKANPDAFVGNNINRLIVGKTLTLPEASSIPDLKPSAPPAAAATDATADKVTLERLQSLEVELKEMEETLKLLEEENADLQDMVKDYETNKQAKEAELTQLSEKVKELESKLASTGAAPSHPGSEADTLAALKIDMSALQTENTELKSQLSSAKQALEESTTATTELKTQLDELKRQNNLLNDDLQRAHASIAVTEKKSVGSSWLPWTLLGLLALLMLPLLWLLKRNREEPRIKTVIAPPKPAAVMPAPKSNEPVSYSDTSTPPVSSIAMPTAEPAVPAEIIPEDPEAELKLDIARAYLDLREPEAAAEMLREVIAEGGSRQRQEAEEILSFIA
jgi:FimV-like protein